MRKIAKGGRGARSVLTGPHGQLNERLSQIVERSLEKLERRAATVVERKNSELKKPLRA